MTRLIFGVLASLCLAGPGLADPYELVVGDRVLVDYDFLDEPRATRVDLDGNIRLLEVGSIPAAGRTLDDVQAAISEAISQGGFSAVSFVLIEIVDYAPVVVSGFVERSGRYEYLPGMDVGAALAIAGGVGSGELDAGISGVQSVNSERRAADAAEQILSATADIARLEAALAGPDTAMELSEAASAAVPGALRDSLPERIEAERQQLAETRSKAEGLVASWNRDIADFESQIVIYDDRIALKQEIVETLAQELADLESLRAQGLTTTARFSTLQQRLADDREELLTLETAKINARRSAGLAARNRDQFLADQREDDLAALERARADLEAGQRDYAFALEELTILGDETAALESAGDDLFTIRYEIRGPRAARLEGAEVDLTTPILPGDILRVELVSGE